MKDKREFLPIDLISVFGEDAILLKEESNLVKGKGEFNIGCSVKNTNCDSECEPLE